jgi:hypothetical protein
MPALHSPAPAASAQMIRYCGYLIRYGTDSYTVTLAGDEVMHQPCSAPRSKVDTDVRQGWVLEQAKAFVDARRAGHV